MIDELMAYLKIEILASPEMELDSDEDLLGSGLVDSLGIVKYIAWIGTRFEIDIPPSDMIIENFMTIDAIAAYIKSKKSE